jgi:hypothetical protein
MAKMRPITTLLSLVAATLAVPAAAQLGIPGISVPQLPSVLGAPLGRTLENAIETVADADRLLGLRAARIERLLRRNREFVELDTRGALATRGELLLLDPPADVLAAVQEAGMTIAGSERLGSLDLSVVRVKLPAGMSVVEGEALLGRIAPRAEVAPDNLHFQTGAAPSAVRATASAAAVEPITLPVGVIDGAPGPQLKVAEMRGFTRGAPTASHHGSAVVSLLQGAGARDVRVADIYGTDRAGGNALSLVRALDWLLAGGARVISVSLSGPNNTVVEKAIAAAQRKGAVIVAAVGNDGPAAPPAYPASYPGVLAVTGVDGRQRALIEAGRAAHLDYAAPGADISARNASGKWRKVRGTSYAVPLVAARTAAALADGSAWRAALDREAQDLGPRGPDPQYGRGLLCRACARGA